MMMNPIVIGVAAWIAAQPVICAAWTWAMTSRRRAGGN